MNPLQVLVENALYADYESNRDDFEVASEWFLKWGDTFESQFEFLERDAENELADWLETHWDCPKESQLHDAVLETIDLGRIREQLQNFWEDDYLIRWEKELKKDFEGEGEGEGEGEEEEGGCGCSCDGDGSQD